MAFDSAGLYIDRGHLNTSKSVPQLGEHSYKTSLDNLETVSSTVIPYFPAYLGDTPANVLVGDLLLLSCPDGFGRFVILETAPVLLLAPQEIDNPTFENITLTNIIQNDTDTKILALNSVTDEVEWRDVSTISAPVETFAGAILLSGAFTIPTSASLFVLKIGDLVTFRIGALFDAATNNTVLTGTLPALAATPVNMIVSSIDATESDNLPISITLAINGTALTISKHQSPAVVDYPFVGDGGNLGWNVFSVTYSVNV